VSAPVVASASSQPARPPVVRLSAVEFDACWELLGLGDTPLTLELPSPGRTWAERHRVFTGVLAALARRAWSSGPRRVPRSLARCACWPVRTTSSTCGSAARTAQ
jgi:hypothetical protein